MRLRREGQVGPGAPSARPNERLGGRIGRPRQCGVQAGRAERRSDPSPAPSSSTAQSPAGHGADRDRSERSCDVTRRARSRRRAMGLAERDRVDRRREDGKGAADGRRDRALERKLRARSAHSGGRGRIDGKRLQRRQAAAQAGLHSTRHRRHPRSDAVLQRRPGRGERQAGEECRASSKSDARSIRGRTAYIAVFDHPYFAVTEKDGQLQDRFAAARLVQGDGVARGHEASRSTQTGHRSTAGGSAKLDLVGEDPVAGASTQLRRRQRHGASAGTRSRGRGARTGRRARAARRACPFRRSAHARARPRDRRGARCSVGAR